MSLDVAFLARLQFALTVMFHYLFPPLTIGLAVFMAGVEAMYLRTGDRLYESAARFWTRIFALNFALGAASGVVMEFQFGTNWSSFSRFVGDVFGSALAAEGIFAFFLESCFLGILVFGWESVSPRLHFFSTLMVALGSVLSAVWIVVANAWQQTPAGYRLVETGHGLRAEITDFWAMVFNPSALPRLQHVLCGAFILGAFFVMSVSAWYVLKGRHQQFARRNFSLALVYAAVASLAALVTGDDQARTVAWTQPAKLAAFEGHFRTEAAGTGLYLCGWPDASGERVRFGLAVPRLLSLLVYRDLDRPVTALDAFKPEDRPPVWLPFQAYHLMIGLGMAFIGLTLAALFMLRRGTLFTRRWLLWIFVFAVLGPYAANQAGWVAAEVGRQPWIVYGLLRTTDGVSRVVGAGQVLVSLALFGLVYGALFALWLWALLEKIRKGPQGAAA